jgi:hypothetical protein
MEHDFSTAETQQENRIFAKPAINYLSTTPKKVQLIVASSQPLLDPFRTL